VLVFLKGWVMGIIMPFGWGEAIALFLWV